MISIGIGNFLHSYTARRQTRADSVLLYLCEERLLKMQNSSNRQMEDDRMFDLCSHVISLDRAIIFCALGHKSGYMIALASSNKGNRHERLHSNGLHIVDDKVGSYRPEETKSSSLLEPFLTEVELEKYVFQSGIIWGIHKLWERKLGKVRHIVSHYDEIPLATIFIDNNHFLLTAIDSKGKVRDVNKIVTQKIIPSLEKFPLLSKKVEG